MPLLDHFHPPLSTERHWESFYATWCGSLADDLNRQLPPGYFAEEQAHFGAGMEIDVATVVGASPPAPALTLPAVFADDFEVRVFSRRGGPTLVAAIELVSLGNKDRREARDAFADKCAGYLRQGVSLIVIDVVTDRHANLHNELLRRLDAPESAQQPADVRLYAAAYRPVRRQEQEQIDVWPAALAVAGPLPVLPLALNAELALPVDLEATYTDACRRRRLG
jgi:hypothetical protein